MIWRQLLILSLEKFSEIGKVIVTSSVSKLVMITPGLLVRREPHLMALELFLSVRPWVTILMISSDRELEYLLRTVASWESPIRNLANLLFCSESAKLSLSPLSSPSVNHFSAASSFDLCTR